MIKTRYKIGDVAYIKTCPDQVARIVAEIVIKPGAILYGLSFIDQVTFHYEFEISPNKDILKSIL